MAAKLELIEIQGPGTGGLQPPDIRNVLKIFCHSKNSIFLKNYYVLKTASDALEMPSEHLIFKIFWGGTPTPPSFLPDSYLSMGYQIKNCTGAPEI